MCPRMVDPDLEKDFQGRFRGEREALSGTFNGVARVLLRGSSEDLLALEGRLRREPGEEGREDGREREELEARNRLRVFARYRSIEGRSLPGSGLRQRLGVSRQRLGQLRKEKRLLGLKLPIHREVHYPLWQFGGDGRPLDEMRRLIEAAEHAGLGAVALDALMTNPEAVDAGGATAAELLRAADSDAREYVLGVVEAALSGGS